MINTFLLWAVLLALLTALGVWAAGRLARPAAWIVARTALLAVRAILASARHKAGRRKKEKAPVPSWDGSCYYQISSGSVLLPEELEIPAFIRRERAWAKARAQIEGSRAAPTPE